MRIVTAAALAFSSLAMPAMAQPHAPNVVLFVADGLRPGMVNEKTAPTMAALLAKGVRFTNTHSLFPTFTTANASGMATGHLIGDTGDFSNTIYAGFPVPSAAGSVTPFLESDAVLHDVDAHFEGDYLDEETILQAARQAGFSTATVGKVGPAFIFDHTEQTGQKTFVVDDMTGRPGGIPLADQLKDRLTKAGLPLEAPTRGANGATGTNTTPGTKVANVGQQTYFLHAATAGVLPIFKERGKPFVMVFWSRDPDGTQHNQGDSLGRLTPGINGPTSLAAIRNADDDLAGLLAKLHELGMDHDTDVILTSDHGFSTISKETGTSWSATQSYKDVTATQLPPGFVAIDLAHALDMKLFDPDAKSAEVATGTYPVRGNGVIGEDAGHPHVVVASNGGSDLIYLPDNDKALAAKVVAALSAQDYVSGLFVNDDLGQIPGTLPLSAVALKGRAATPTPSIVVNFRSFSLGCDDPTTCGVEVADTGLQQGQGMHGSFSRADTRNIMAAMGPGFRQHFVSAAPASNADLGKTIAALLKLNIPSKGKLVGRVLTEAMPNGAEPAAARHEIRSAPDSLGHVTVVQTQQVGQTRYFDVAGYPGRSLGLPAEMLGSPTR
jgi:arylsulfatase A-like enzyme